jgi:DNA-binding response OmpR family regulator
MLIYSAHGNVVDAVKRAVNHGIYLTRAATDEPVAAAIFREWDPQLAVVDIDGGVEQVLNRVGLSRDTRGTSVPVLAVTRRGDVETKLTAFRHGVDDVMTLPFCPDELLARILVMTRRRLGETPPLNPVLKLGDLEIDILGRRVRDGSAELRLTGIEQSLLCLLAANAGEVVSHDQILDALWGTDYAPDSNVVGRHIYRLRAKLQSDWRQPRTIVTVPGHGYRFIPEFLQIKRASSRPGIGTRGAGAKDEQRLRVESARPAVVASPRNSKKNSSPLSPRPVATLVPIERTPVWCEAERA